MAGLLFHRQLVIGGKDQLCFQLGGGIGAERKIFPFLEKPQQLDLGGATQIAYFVQKQCPAPRLLDHPLSLPLGTGKGAPGMTEKSV